MSPMQVTAVLKDGADTKRIMSFAGRVPMIGEHVMLTRGGSPERWTVVDVIWDIFGEPIIELDDV